MTRQGKSILRFALPLCWLAAVYLSAPGIISSSANAQCSRPGFKLNYGNFSPAAHRAVTADFNADGKMDIATSADATGVGIGVYFGNGMGGFSAPVVYPASRSSKMFVADMNNDARPDIVLITITTPNPNVAVFLNNGSGAFGSPVTSSFQLDTTSAQVADLNGDGKGDLVHRSIVCCTGVVVRFGDGLGNFAAPINYPLAGANGFVVGDFNSDTKKDLAVLSNTGAMRGVTLYLNDGAGGLVLGMETVLGDNTNLSVAGDFNGDGKVDLAGYNQPTPVVVLLNNGSGGFTRTNYSVPSSAIGIRDGDFNGDGNVDLIACGFLTFIQTANSSMLYGNGMGGFTLGENFGPVRDWLNTGSVADFNGDGKSDLVISTSTGIRVFLRTCNDVGNTKRIDYDGDGATDFAVWRPSDGNWIIDQSASNTRRTERWGGGSFGDVPVPGDYDGDNKSDLAVFRAPTSVWYVLRSSDNTPFGIQWGTMGDKPVPGDYDADGKTDIAVFRPADGGWYILRSSDNTLSAFVFGTSGDKPVQADFDNDDKTDVAVFRPSNGFWYMLKSSDGSFSAVHFGANTDKPVPADYDGDGKADVAVFRPGGSGFFFLNSWNNAVSGFGDFLYFGTPSAADMPAPMKRGDNFAAYIWRPASGLFGGIFNNASGQIGMSGDIPVVTPYVIE